MDSRDVEPHQQLRVESPKRGAAGREEGVLLQYRCRRYFPRHLWVHVNGHVSHTGAAGIVETCVRLWKLGEVKERVRKSGNPSESGSRGRSGSGALAFEIGFRDWYSGYRLGTDLVELVLQCCWFSWY